MTSTCSQKTCNEPGEYRFTWPGRGEGLACLDHARQLVALATSMGFTLEMIPLYEVIGRPARDLAPEERARYLLSKLLDHLVVRGDRIEWKIPDAIRQVVVELNGSNVQAVTPLLALLKDARASMRALKTDEEQKLAERIDAVLEPTESSDSGRT